MAADLASEITKELNKFVEGFVSDLSVGIQQNLGEDTPKDTSWASVNWIVSLEGQPTFAATPISRAGKLSSVPTRRAEQIAFSQILKSRYTLSMGPIKISNEVPYIVDLNFGSSSKAPAGFVQSSITKTIIEKGGTR